MGFFGRMSRAYLEESPSWSGSALLKACPPNCQGDEATVVHDSLSGAPGRMVGVVDRFESAINQDPMKSINPWSASS